MNAPTRTGHKADDGKLPMHLLDRHAIEQMAKVMQYGAKKYSAENWRGGIEYTRLIAAAMRHLFAISDGEDVDPESRLYHAAHVMCCMQFLLWMMKHRADLDDRFTPGAPTPLPKIDEAALIAAMESASRELASQE